LLSTLKTSIVTIDSSITRYEKYTMAVGLHEDFTKLIWLKKKYDEKISPGESLPEEYEHAFQTLRWFLDKAAKGLSPWAMAWHLLHYATFLRENRTFRVDSNTDGCQGRSSTH
jgi:hypothetical protein